MPTTQVDSDTTIFIIGRADTPLWYAAPDTPEEAVAEAITGTGLSVSPDSFRVSKISAGDFASYEPSLKRMQRAERDAIQLRTYDHEKALRLAEDVDFTEADSRIKALDERLAEMR